MSIFNDSGGMSSSTSPDEGTIPSKEFRKRQVNEMECPFWNDVHHESNKGSDAFIFIYFVARSNFRTVSINCHLRTV